MIRLALAGAMALAFCLSATARDNGQWNGLDPETRQWFKDLKNDRGVSCCSEMDGRQVDDVDYHQNDDGSYEVNLGNRWIHVDQEHVINPKNRKVEYAIVWPFTYRVPRDKNSAYCFMPGTGY